MVNRARYTTYDLGYNNGSYFKTYNQTFIRI